MTPSATKRLDRVLWYAISILFAGLAFVSLLRIDSYKAFIELKSSTLRLDFTTQRREQPIAYFGETSTIYSAPASALKGMKLKEISTLSRQAALRMEALDPKSNTARICLLQGRYSLSLRSRKQRHEELKIDLRPDEEWCMDAALNEDFLVLPTRLVIEDRVDSRGVRVYPDMTGKLRIQNTDRELNFVSGITLHLLPLKDPATSITLAEGHFGIHAWKEIRVLWSDSGKLVAYYFTPLDVLRKYAGDNGLWFSISVAIGIVFGIRQLLSLR